MNDSMQLDDLYNTFVKFKRKQDSHILAKSSNKPNHKRVSRARKFYDRNKYYPNRSYELRSVLNRKRKKGRNRPGVPKMSLVNLSSNDRVSSIPKISFSNVIKRRSKESRSPKSKLNEMGSNSRYSRDRLFLKMKQRNIDRMKLSKKKENKVKGKAPMMKKKKPLLERIPTWSKQGIKNSDPGYSGKSKILKEFEEKGSFENSFRNRYIGDGEKTLPFKVRKLNGVKESCFFIGDRKSEIAKPLVGNANDYIRFRPKIARRKSIHLKDKRLKSWSMDIQSFDSSAMDPFRF